MVQFSVLFLLGSGNWLGWSVIRGNLSAAEVLGTIQLADPYAVLQMLASGYVASTAILLGALIVMLLYGILFGRAFCSWICPVNIVADLSAWVNRKFSLRLKNQKFRLNRNWRYWLFVLGLALSAVFAFPAFEAVSPIGITVRGIIFGFGFGWAVIVLVFLLDLLIADHAWCGHLCPLGAFYSAISRINILKVYHHEDRCTKCNKCFVVCPEVQVLDRVGKSEGFIFDGECTNCARCIEVCEDNALLFSLNNFRIK